MTNTANEPVGHMKYRCEACGVTTFDPATHEHHWHDGAQTCWGTEWVWVSSGAGRREAGEDFAYAVESEDEWL